jgi:hypothetical protein
MTPRSAGGVVCAPLSAETAAPPRLAVGASEQALTELGTFCLKAFLVAQFFSLTRLFFGEHLGSGLLGYATAAGVGSIALLFPAVVSHGLRAGSLFGTLVPGARLWLAATSALAAGLFLYGWLAKGYAVEPTLHDLGPYVVILSSVVLGSIRRVWRDTDRLILALFVAGLLVNVVAMTEITTVASELDAEGRVARDVLGYRTQWALAFWPLLLLTARSRPPRTALVILAGSFFVLVQQILFQKRSPSVRVALFLAVFLLVLPRFQPQAQAEAERRTKAMVAAVGALVLAAALTLSPWLFRGQLAGLARRLSGESYSGGAAAMLTWENERFFEAGMFFRTLQPLELVVGRGFGGYFVADTPGWGVWMDDLHQVASRALHIGALMPFFKGGLVFTVTYYAGLALALVRGRRCLHDPLGAAAFFVLLLHAVFIFQESWFSLSTSFDLVMVGLCMGYLLSRERDAAPPRARRLALVRPRT